MFVSVNDGDHNSVISIFIGLSYELRGFFIYCNYCSLAKKGPVSKPPPYFALISCKSLKFTLKSTHPVLTLWSEDFH